ncbi:MAG: sulfite exporter TauE/SafE family protein, partial [Rhizobiaceae bacterium]|nr:sulfite exporter TauE/SafE family protein [Rhizobiaceae bacterium]
SVPGVIGYVLAGLWAGDVSGTMPEFSLGFVNLLTVALVIPITSLVAPIGVRTAHALSKRKLEVAFGVFMFVVAGRFFYSLAG